MTTTAIQVTNLGKRYWKSKTRAQEFITLRDQLLHWQRPQREEFWALSQVSFRLSPGQVLGVIGRNGAGKSTLFKLLSRITKPTTGEIQLIGRVASMLEIGTGFHPELSGRENIFLNGAILGMHRQETAAKFAQIVKFSGVANFLEDPVKYYSSGMYMRLAFAIAAFLSSEIMIIDEVLAVGDQDFQQQCLRKIHSLVHDEGRTILLVSHNLTSIKQFCNHCLWLEAGRIKMFGSVASVLRTYQNQK
jgi:lipopolysaccharide transport system ATP-binding protein